MQLQDGMTPILRSMTNALNTTISSFEAMKTASSSSVNTASISAARAELTKASSAIDMMEQNINKAATAQRNLNDQVHNTSGAFGGLIGKFAIGGVIANMITSITEKIAEIPSKLGELSDEYSGILSRIKLITQGEEQAAALNDQIYYSALRARGSYAGMADAVSKIGLTAKEAFPDPNAIVPFVENIQKLFSVGGTGIQQQKDAMLQLTQALGSGKLQGDEFRSIAEAAPMIEQIVARFMGVTQGQLKELSSQGAITADIIKNAVLGATDEINQKFAAMPMTWGQVWQNMKTVAFREFVPVFNLVSALANSDAVKGLGQAFSVGIHYAAIAILGIVNNLQWLGGIAMTVGNYIGSWLSAGFVIAGEGLNSLMGIAGMAFPYIVGAALDLAAAWAILNYQMISGMIVESASVAWHALVAAWMWIQTAAIWAVSAAKAVWAAITMGVVGAQMMLAFVIALVTGNLYIIAAVIIGVIVAALAVWGLASVNLRDVFADAMDFMIDACQNGVNAMGGMINGLIDLINKAAGGLNSLFGTNIGTIEHVGTVDFQGAKKWTNYIREGTLMEHLKGSMGDVFSMPDFSVPEMPSMSGMAADSPAAVDTAKNTGAMKDKMDIVDEDLKYLRDVAEQEVINRFTTAEIKIDMTNHNTVNSEMDLDGIVNHLENKLDESMRMAAEGVHK